MANGKMNREREIYKVTLVGGAANLLLLVFKFVAGIVGHSSAMIADAAHSLSDFVTDIVVLVFVKISSKPKDKSHDYGHGKFETLALTIIGIAIDPFFQHNRHDGCPKGQHSGSFKSLPVCPSSNLYCAFYNDAYGHCHQSYSDDG